MLSAEKDFRFYSGLTNQGFGADAAKVARWNIRAPTTVDKGLDRRFFLDYCRGIERLLG